MFMLRAVDTTEHQEQLQAFDSLIRGSLSRILGSTLTDTQWAQASLPVTMGGLRLRSAVDHAAVAHAVSLLSAQSLLDGLLGEEEEGPRLPQPVLDQISAKTGEEASVESLTGVPQKKASQSKRKNICFLAPVLALVMLSSGAGQTGRTGRLM